MDMEIYNKNYNQTFGAKLGTNAKFYLRKYPEKLEEITRNLANAGKPTTVVEIMTSKTCKGKMYSLRLFNEKIGEWLNKSLLKNNYNKDVVKYAPSEFISDLEALTKSKVEMVEQSVLNLKF